MYKKNKFKRMSAALLAFGMFLSSNGVSTTINKLAGMIPLTATAVAPTPGPASAEGEHILFTEEMERQSTTVIFKHWHLIDSHTEEDKLTTVEIPEEYRFYQAYDGAVQLYQKATEEQIAEKYFNDGTHDYSYQSTDPDDQEKEFVLVGYTDTVVINAQDQYSDSDKIKEQFSNFSISSGHDSVKVLEKDEQNNLPARLEITYSPDSNNHIIKGHAFYVNHLTNLKGADFSDKNNEYLHNVVFLDGDGNEQSMPCTKNPYWNENFTEFAYTGEIDVCYDSACNILFYNTASGLHTYKTVKESGDDGRTFDLNLEAWYSGGDIADIGFVLDASGSMAWTTNVIEPLQIDADIIANNNIPTGTILTSEQVDMILNKANTDNTRLSYSEYNYYVYEELNTDVAEFVPLAYWDGNMNPSPPAKIEDFDVVGYYPFDDSLDNNAPKADGSGRFVQKSDWNEEITPGSEAIDPTFKNGGIDILKTGENGNIFLDIDISRLNDIKNFTIQFELYGSDASGADWTPFFYIGDREMTNYITIKRGNDGNKNNIGIFDNTGTRLFHARSTVDNAKNNFRKITLVINEGKLSVYNSSGNILNENNNGSTEIDISGILNKFSTDDLCFILGGNDLYDGSGTLSSNYIRNVLLANGADPAVTKDTGPSGTVIGYYTLNGDLNNAKRSSTPGKYIAKATEDGFDVESVAAMIANATSYTGANTGYGGTGKALNLTKTAPNGTILLDQVPNSGNFTLSFAVKKEGADNQPANLANILYMGKDIDEYPAYMIYRREGGSQNRLRFDEYTESNPIGGINRGAATMANVNNIFNNDAGWKIMTFTVSTDENGITTINTYLDGDPVATATTENFDAIKDQLQLAIGAMWDNGYNGADIYLDELYVIDETLTESKVKSFYNIISDNGTNTTTSTVAYDNDGNVLASQLATNLTNAPLEDRRGWYYVNSHTNWADITNPDIGTGKQFRGIKNPASCTAYTIDIPFNQLDVSTPSAFVGAASFTDMKTVAEENRPELEVTSGREMADRFFIIKAPAVKLNENQQLVYDTSVSDDVYYLVAYTAAGTYNFCSFVYYKPDSERIKSESLQYVLASFASKMREESSRARFSAARFSTQNAKDELNKLVMMDWTKDTSRGIVSARRGGDTTASSEKSSPSLVNEMLETTSPLLQYNYGLTGGTYTWTGLQAYIDNLNTERIKRYKSDGTTLYEDQGEKYLIIFTDGRDNTIRSDENDSYTGGTEAIERANTLKDNGYTIFCVMFVSGSVSKENNPTEYAASKAFLTDLAGTNDPNDDPSKYVFADAKNDKELEEAFDIIFEAISSRLRNYTVQDYIDPRFDLIEKTKNDSYTIELGALGTIKLRKSDGSYEDFSICKQEIVRENGSTGDIIKRNNVTVDGVTKLTGEYYYVYKTLDGKEAHLHYDSERDMYYLQWVGEEIPGSAVNSDYISVWSSKIRIKAKDDFIGGNSILTNGNLELMNYVFDPFDGDENLNGSEDGDETWKTPSSGTDQSDPQKKQVNKKDLEYSPSKGFPRTTANVRLLPLEAKPLISEYYMGEVIAPEELLMEIESEYVTDSYYLEYLKRYAYQRYLHYKELHDSETNQDMVDYYKEQMDMPLIKLLHEWLKINNNNNEEEKSFSVPYIYLPSVPFDENGNITSFNKTNNTGSPDSNEKDVVGILTYRWEKIEPEYDKENPAKQYVLTDTERICYSLTVEFTPFKDGDTENSFENVPIKDEAFADDTREGSVEKLFADFLDDYNVVEKDNLIYDRVKSNNAAANGLIRETQTPKENTQQNERVFLWNKDRYGAIDGKVQPEYDTDEDGNPKRIEIYDDEGEVDGYETDKNGFYRYEVKSYAPDEPDKKYYGDAQLLNKGRTLEAQATYTKDIVSGGIALELKVPVKDLKAELDENGGFTTSFKLKATRSFTDTDYVQTFKDTLEDYGSDFYLTFEFTYTKAEIDELIGDFTDEDFVSLFARATDTICTWDGKTTPISELPIGTYKFTMDEMEINGTGNYSFGAEDEVAGKPTISYIRDVRDPDKFLETRPYSDKESAVALDEENDGDNSELLFEKVILNGLNTTNENPQKYKDDEEYPEIDSGNITEFVVDSTSGADSKSATFYLGTSGSSDKRGEENRSTDDYYINKRLGMLVLSTANVSLTVSKECENTKIKEDLEVLWEFDITLTSDKPLADNDGNYTLDNTQSQPDNPNIIYKDSNNNNYNFDETIYPTSITFEYDKDNSDPDTNKYIYTAKVQLRHGQSVTLAHIGSGTETITYKVEEKKNDEFDYEANFDKFGNSGYLEVGSEVEYVNRFNYYDLPEFGGVGTNWIIAAAFSLLYLSILVFIYVIYDNCMSKRKKNKNGG